jgi:hypothetical protein
MQFPYLFSARPDYDRQVSERLLLNTQFPYLLNAHPDHDWRLNGCIWIPILTLYMRASRRESTSSGRLHQSSLIWTWIENLKLIDHWTSSGRAAKMSGRMQAGIEASRFSGGSERKSTSSKRMILGLSGVWTVWHIVRTDGTVDRWAFGQNDTSSGWLTGNRKSSDLQAVQNLLKHFWIVESLWKASLHTSDFVQSKWGQSQTNNTFCEKSSHTHTHALHELSNLFKISICR